MRPQEIIYRLWDVYNTLAFKVGNDELYELRELIETLENEL